MAELLRLLRKFKFIFVLLLFVIGFINNVNLDYNVVKLEGIGFWLNGFILLLGIVIILNMVISYIKK